MKNKDIPGTPMSLFLVQLEFGPKWDGTHALGTDVGDCFRSFGQLPPFQPACRMQRSQRPSSHRQISVKRRRSTPPSLRR